MTLDEIITTGAGLYAHTLVKGEIEAYRRALSRYALEDVAEAFRQHQNDRNEMPNGSVRGEFWPKIARWVHLCESLARRRREDAERDVYLREWSGAKPARTMRDAINANPALKEKFENLMKKWEVQE